MKTLVILVLAISLNALAKPKASDFKEIHSQDDSAVEEASAVSDAAPQVILKENEEILSGSVRVMRKIDKTEVFFKDLKNSYTIQSGASYSSLYKAFEQSQKKGTSISFKANTKTRQVLSLEDSKGKSPAGAATGSNSKNGVGSQ